MGGAGLATVSSAPPGAQAPALRSDLHYAVVVGINKYPGLPTSLRGPEGDAQEFYNWLVSPSGGGLKPSNVRHITVKPATVINVDSAIPTRQLVNDALESVMSQLAEDTKADRRLWDYSRLYLYLSGHGIAPHAREAALLMANAKFGRLGENIPSASYMSFFEDEQTFHELVVFADCCRTVKGRAALLPPPWDRTAPDRKKNGNVATVIGFATAFGDLAYEPTPQEEANPDLARGFFTQALLEGLKGSAANRQTGAITSEDLSKYLHQRVLDLTRAKTAPQEPFVYHNAAVPMVFREPSPVPRWDVTINFPATQLTEVVLTDGITREFGRRDPALGPWTVPLVNGLYEVRPIGSATGSMFLNEGLFRVTGEARNVQL